MRMRGIEVLFLGVVFIVFYSCSSDKKKPVSRQIQRTKKVETAKKLPPGNLVYMQFCMACHMENGEGVPGLYPPLVQTECMLGDKKRLIEIVLHGMDGLSEVKGQQYNNVMAKLDYLSDKQISEVLSFVRSNFGNNAEAVTIEEVKMVRSAGKK